MERLSGETLKGSGVDICLLRDKRTIHLVFHDMDLLQWNSLLRFGWVLILERELQGGPRYPRLYAVVADQERLVLR